MVFCMATLCVSFIEELHEVRSLVVATDADTLPAKRTTDIRVVIVGAGIGGLGMARAMKLAGIPVTVLEKAPSVGGTWWHNRYPGLKCDVPVIAYRYEFEPLAGNSQSLLPTADELLARAQRLCDDNGLRDLIRLNSEVVKAEWAETRWLLTLADGEVVEGEVVVFCTGFLHHPYVPDIEGMPSFRGPVVHAAQWDPGIQVAGKRVAVIGSGSTGCQLVPAFAGTAANTVMFARNPQWILPIPDLPMPRWFTALLTRFPELDKKVRSTVLTGVMRLLGGVREGFYRKLFTFLCERNLASVKDPELRAALTPKDPPLCKRPVMSTTFYPAIQRPDVELVTEHIDRITEIGIRTKSGVDYELDVIVLATGYKAQNYMRPMKVIGEDGRTIDEEWRDDPYAYHSLTVPGFPNMFVINGPLSPRTHIGPHENVEQASKYVTQFIRALDEQNAISMAPRPEATKQWVDEIVTAANETSLAACSSWYQGKSGAPLVFTLSRERWHQDTGHFEIKDYIIRRRADEPVTV